MLNLCSVFQSPPYFWLSKIFLPASHWLNLFNSLCVESFHSLSLASTTMQPMFLKNSREFVKHDSSSQRSSLSRQKRLYLLKNCKIHFPNTYTCAEFVLDSTLSTSSVQSLSSVRLFATPWTAAHQTSLSSTNSQSLPKLMSIESVMPPNQLILCRPLLPPSVSPSIRVLSNESVPPQRPRKIPQRPQ